MFFNKIKFAGIFSIVPAAKPTTTTLAFHLTHFKLGTIRPCEYQEIKNQLQCSDVSPLA